MTILIDKEPKLRKWYSWDASFILVGQFNCLPIPKKISGRGSRVIPTQAASRALGWRCTVRPVPYGSSSSRRGSATRTRDDRAEENGGDDTAWSTRLGGRGVVGTAQAEAEAGQQ